MNVSFSSNTSALLGVMAEWEPARVSDNRLKSLTFPPSYPCQRYYVYLCEILNTQIRSESNSIFLQQFGSAPHILVNSGLLSHSVHSYYLGFPREEIRPAKDNFHFQA